MISPKMFVTDTQMFLKDQTQPQHVNIWSRHRLKVSADEFVHNNAYPGLIIHTEIECWSHYGSFHVAVGTWDYVHFVKNEFEVKNCLYDCWTFLPAMCNLPLHHLFFSLSPTLWVKSMIRPCWRDNPIHTLIISISSTSQSCTSVFLLSFVKRTFTHMYTLLKFTRRLKKSVKHSENDVVIKIDPWVRQSPDVVNYASEISNSSIRQFMVIFMKLNSWASCCFRLL